MRELEQQRKKKDQGLNLIFRDMKVTHYIMPRNSGKTTEINSLYQNDKDTLIVYSNLFKKRFIRCLVDKIVIDDYISFANRCIVDIGLNRFKDWLYGVLLPCLNTNGELILYSTPDKMYTKESIYQATLFDNQQFDFELRNKVENVLGVDFAHQQFEKDELYKGINLKFLNLNTNVVVKGEAMFSKEHKEQTKRSLGMKLYLTEIEGRYIW